jgi:enoyl-CoA hydratase/carnithine racemase
MEGEPGNILGKKDGGIGWLIVNNPQRRNALTAEMWGEMSVALQGFSADPEIRVLIIRGEGGKSFVSGADISQFEKQRSNAAQAAEYAKPADEARRLMSGLPIPFIAMIQGFCIGGGMAVAMKADIRVASDDSQFGIPAARLGLAYNMEALDALTKLVGPAFAKEILFTGRRLPADEAHRIGLVNRVVPASDLEQTVRQIADQIVNNAPLTIRAAKFTIDQSLLDADKRDLETVAALGKACFDSEDYAEGRRAFMEKRSPVFSGR